MTWFDVSGPTFWDISQQEEGAVAQWQGTVARLNTPLPWYALSFLRLLIQGPLVGTAPTAMRVMIGSNEAPEEFNHVFASLIQGNETIVEDSFIGTPAFPVELIFALSGEPLPFGVFARIGELSVVAGRNFGGEGYETKQFDILSVEIDVPVAPALFWTNFRRTMEVGT